MRKAMMTTHHLSDVATRARTPDPAGPRLLLALPGSSRPKASLRRAAAAARSFDGSLHVLCVLGEAPRFRAPLQAHREMVATRTAQQTRRARRSIHAWLRATLADTQTVESLAIVHGDFVEQVSVHAANIDARLIVVPARSPQPGSTMTMLARAAQRPVLVAQEHRGNPTILAATDLRTPGHPVLRHAAELGQRFGARLVAFHNGDTSTITVENLQPGMMTGSFTMTSACAAMVNAAQLRTARRAQLTAAVAVLPVDSSVAVVDQVGSARAILAQANRVDPDCVVVGTRQRDWFQNLSSRSVSAEVVERARHSVLVVPLSSQIPGSKMTTPATDIWRSGSEPSAPNHLLSEHSSRKGGRECRI